MVINRILSFAARTGHAHTPDAGLKSESFNFPAYGILDHKKLKFYLPS